MTVRVLAPALLAAVACASCISFRFDRTTVNFPPKDGAVASLVPGQATLDDALRALGAPVLVWEWHGDGMAIAWGWSRDDSRGVTLSVPLDHGQSAQASYDDLARHLQGVVVFFDADGRLVEAREGRLNELGYDGRRRRPALVEPEPGG